MKEGKKHVGAVRWNRKLIVQVRQVPQDLKPQDILSQVACNSISEVGDNYPFAPFLMW
jgi:hypothetical protein